MGGIRKAAPLLITLLIVVVVLSNMFIKEQQPTPFEGWTKKYGVFSINLDGSDLELIYQSDTQINHLHISPDGTKILFSEFTQDLNGDGTANEDDLFSAEVGIMNVDGTGYRLLTGPDLIIDAVPVWSPDGTEILFASSRDSTEENFNLDLYVMNLAGENVRRLTATDGVIEADPHWIGNKIAFTRLVGGENQQTLWLMNSDGSGARQLTFPSFSVKSKAAFNFGDFDPKISPNGTKVASYRHLDDNLVIGEGVIIGNYDLFII
jgi:Tol biopolymer transport system component